LYPNAIKLFWHPKTGARYSNTFKNKACWNKSFKYPKSIQVYEFLEAWSYSQQMLILIEKAQS